MSIEALLQHVRIQHTKTRRIIELWEEILEKLWYA